jgi:hypothetical protein
VAAVKTLAPVILTSSDSFAATSSIKEVEEEYRWRRRKPCTTTPTSPEGAQRIPGPAIDWLPGWIFLRQAPAQGRGNNVF